MSRANKIIIGIGYNKKTNNAEKLAIYDVKLDKTEILTTKQAKDKADAKQLSVVNANLGFFVNSVDMTIGEQFDYPVLFFTDKKTYTIENAVIVFDPKPDESKLYNCIYIANNNIDKKKLTTEQLLNVAENDSYKKNYFVEDGKIKFKLKQNSVTEVYTDETYIIKPIFEKWYELESINGMQEMVKLSNCNVKTFSADGIQIIDGFANSDTIEEVDLSGAMIINPKAFDGCSNLKKVILSDSLLSIGDYAFRDCKNLKEIDIPKTAKIGSRIFDNGTAYLHKDLYGVMAPFGPNVKIVIEGKAKKNEKLQIAVGETSKTVTIFEIDTISAKIKCKEQNKSDIGPLDTIINYKTEEDRIYSGDMIIAGLTGSEYVCIDPASIDNQELLIKSFDDLQGFNVSNAMVIGNEYKPINPDWGWNFINIVNSKNVASSKLGAYIAAASDDAFILTDSQKMLFGEYIAYKFRDMFNNISIRSMKKKEKVELAKVKYEGYTFMISNKLPMIPGGLAESDNPKKYDKNGKEIKFNKKGWRFCYFGHPTLYHWVVTGKKDGERDLTFTFGRDCFADFLGIDRADIERLEEFESVMAAAVDEVEKVIKNKSFKDNIRDNLLFYDMMKALQCRTDNGFYTNLGLKFLEERLIVPQCVKEDICTEWRNGHSEPLSLGCESRYTEDIYKKLIPDETDKIHMIYNYPVVSIKNNKEYKDCLAVSEKLELIISSELQHNSKKSFKALKEIKTLIHGLKFDSEIVKKCKKIRDKFDSMGLPDGEYCINETWFVNTNSATIYKGVEWRPLCSLDSEIPDDIANEIKNAEKTYRPTIIFKNKYGSQQARQLELAYVSDAKRILSLIDHTKLNQKEYKGIIYSYLGHNYVAVAATKDFIICYMGNNDSKPVMIIKNGKINYTDNYGMFDTVSFKYSKRLDKYFVSRYTKGTSYSPFINTVKIKEDVNLFNGKGEYKSGKNGIKYLSEVLLKNIPKDVAKLQKEYSLRDIEAYLNESIVELKAMNLPKNCIIGLNKCEFLHYKDENNFEIYDFIDEAYTCKYENGKIAEITDWSPNGHSMKIVEDAIVYTYDTYSEDLLKSDNIKNIGKHLEQKNNIIEYNKDFKKVRITKNSVLYYNNKEVAKFIRKDKNICHISDKTYIHDDNSNFEERNYIPSDLLNKTTDEIVKYYKKQEEEKLKVTAQERAEYKEKAEELLKTFDSLIVNKDLFKAWKPTKEYLLTYRLETRMAFDKLLELKEKNDPLIVKNIDEKLLKSAMDEFSVYLKKYKQKYKDSDKILIEGDVKDMIDNLDKIDQWGDPKYLSLEKSILQQVKDGKSLTDRQRFPFNKALSQFKDWRAKQP